MWTMSLLPAGLKGVDIRYTDIYIQFLQHGSQIRNFFQATQSVLQRCLSCTAVIHGAI